MPLPTYLLAILTTRRRLASASLFLAFWSPFSILFASSISSSADRSGTLPISFKYILTGSSMLTPSGIDKSIFSMSISSSSPRRIGSSSISSSVVRIISILLASRKSKILSILSGSRSISANASIIS